LSWILYAMWGKGVVSFFCLCAFSFATSIYWRDCFFLPHMFFVQKQLVVWMWINY
jgi:hypothetical protein